MEKHLLEPSGPIIGGDLRNPSPYISTLSYYYNKAMATYSTTFELIKTSKSTLPPESSSQAVKPTV
jgi:hypothetical protein